MGLDTRLLLAMPVNQRQQWCGGVSCKPDGTVQRGFAFDLLAADAVQQLPGNGRDVIRQALGHP